MDYKIKTPTSLGSSILVLISKKNMKRIALIVFCSNIIFGSCQTNNSTTGVNSKDYMAVIKEKCANPDIIEIEKTDDGYVEIEYLCEGNKYEIGIKNNSVIYNEEAITVAEIPYDKISKKIEKKYNGWIIDEISRVTSSDTSFIKIEILKDGIEQNIYFANDGKWYKIRTIEPNTSVDFEKISQNKTYKSVGYNFNNPENVYEMPALLNEISGIAIGDNNTAYCIQDEIGSIFKYDFSKKQITQSFRFTDIGDFEDIALNYPLTYILRSDGNVIAYDLNSQKEIQQSMLPVNSLNIEGLFYYNNNLLIASKDALVNEDADSPKRHIYIANTNNLNKIELFIELDMNYMLEFVKNNYSEFEITRINFNPSAIAVHPKTNEVYILSATDRYLAIYKEQQLINIIPLSAEVYYKPEGLSFLKNGDLLISSEGDKKGFINGGINYLKYQNNN